VRGQPDRCGQNYFFASRQPIALPVRGNDLSVDAFENSGKTGAARANYHPGGYMKNVKTVEEWKEILDAQLPHRAADTILQSLIGYCYRDISRHRDEDTQSLANALRAFTKISHAGN
jgi:hypothetical protein